MVGEVIGEEVKQGGEEGGARLESLLSSRGMLAGLGLMSELFMNAVDQAWQSCASRMVRRGQLLPV